MALDGLRAKEGGNNYSHGPWNAVARRRIDPLSDTLHAIGHYYMPYSSKLWALSAHFIFEVRGAS